jgi:hypothetical protein
MAHASLLNDNLAHKLVLALLQDDTLSAARYTDLLGRVSQVLTEVRNAHPEPVEVASGADALTAYDALAITSGCLDNSGGYRDDPEAAAAFKQGAKGVYDAVDLQARAGGTSFENALFAAKSALSRFENYHFSSTNFYNLHSDADKAAMLARCDGAKTAYLLLEQAAVYGLADGQVLAAHQIGTKRPLCPVPPQTTVSEERGEQLLDALEEGIASPVAQDLRSRILAGDKVGALEVLSDERMTGQDAEDLYAYCHQKWLGKRLAVVEVPPEHAEEVVRKNLPADGVFDGYGPLYLVRRGKSVETSRARKSGNQLCFNLSRDDIEIKDVKQLWMVVELP